VSLFRKYIRLSLAAVAVVLFASACGSDSPVATVGTSPLETSDLDVDDSSIATVGISTLKRSDLGVAVADRAVLADVITNWARNELFFAEMAERGYTPDESFFAASRAELEDLRLTDLTLPDPDTIEGEIAIRGNALAAILADFLVAEGFEMAAHGELCSSHILLETEAEALAAIERLDAGEDFAALAMELSTGPSGPAGGDLGCVDSRSFVAEFVDGARDIEAPGITAPTESQFGWHVIEVSSFDLQPTTDPAESIDLVLASTEFQDLQAAAITREVTVDPEFGEWDTETVRVIP
jgi:parvulin-like peptidyl-prolyl isomerase